MIKPEKALTLLFLRQDDRVLLAMKKRGFGVGRWNGIGGKVEQGESIEQALVRETQEEISVTPLQYKKVADLRFDEFFKGIPTLMHVHVYMCSKWEGEPIASEEMDPEWFAIDAIPYDDMWPDDPYWLPQVLSGKIISADLVLDKNDAIVSYKVKVVTELPK